MTFSIVNSCMYASDFIEDFQMQNQAAAAFSKYHYWRWKKGQPKPPPFLHKMNIFFLPFFSSRARCFFSFSSMIEANSYKKLLGALSVLLALFDGLTFEWIMGGGGRRRRRATASFQKPCYHNMLLCIFHDHRQQRRPLKPTEKSWKVHFSHCITITSCH